MKSELDPIKTKRLSLLGPHQLTLSGIKWVGSPSDEEYAAACALSGVIKRVEAWVDGDLIAEYVRREKDRRPSTSVRSLVAEYAAHASLQFDQCYERYHVALTFLLDERSPSLTWSHHRVVWAHGGEYKRDKLKWLLLAQENNWDVRTLSAAIMAQKAPPPTQPIPSLFPLDLQSAVDYAHSHLDEIASLPPEQATQRALELEPVVLYHARCQLRANEHQQGEKQG